MRCAGEKIMAARTGKKMKGSANKTLARPSAPFLMSIKSPIPPMIVISGISKNKNDKMSSSTEPSNSRGGC